MRTPAFTKDEFHAALYRLGERDVRRLLAGKALDGDEARWAAEWLANPTAPVAAPQPQYEPLRLAS